MSLQLGPSHRVGVLGRPAFSPGDHRISLSLMARGLARYALPQARACRGSHVVRYDLRDDPQRAAESGSTRQHPMSDQVAARLIGRVVRSQRSSRPRAATCRAAWIRMANWTT
jgi:hypothetical protein